MMPPDTQEAAFLITLGHDLGFCLPGFRMNASSWPMFLLRTLNGAEMAPATAFKKVRNAESLENKRHC